MCWSLTIYKDMEKTAVLWFALEIKAVYLRVKNEYVCLKKFGAYFQNDIMNKVSYALGLGIGRQLQDLCGEDLNLEDFSRAVKEEISEYEEAAKNGSSKASESEFGDLLFSLVNAARLYGINPDNALEMTNRKFISRFNHIESTAKANGKNVSELSLGEMDRFWNEAKHAEKNNN